MTDSVDDTTVPADGGAIRRTRAAGPGDTVLLISAAGVLGGAERVLLAWAQALERPALLACPPGPLAEAAASAGLRVAPLRDRPLRRRGRSVRAALELAALARDVARLARQHRPAVVVASGRRPLLAAAVAPLAGARVVALHHDLPAAPPSGQHLVTLQHDRPAAPLGAPRLVTLQHDLAGAPQRWALRAASARSAAVVATSGAIARAADPRGRRPGRTHVVHPGVSAAEWALPDPPPEPPRALCLGALVPWKRADLALEIAARTPELALDLAGEPLPGDPPGFAAALHARAARPDLAGRVRFLGALADPRPALAAAHCLLHCAEQEPFGLALVEALAAGRPVVAPAAGGPLEIVTPACGRLYAPGDADAGAAALRAVLADPGLRAGARARAGDFDGRAAARRFAAVVEGIASER
jgi:glycosyltransferase involved in cell wall biosynthesis